METGKIEVVRLTASEGMMLTQAGDVPEGKRIYCRMAYLGKGDSPQNWREVPAREAEQAMAARQAGAECEGVAGS